MSKQTEQNQVALSLDLEGIKEYQQNRPPFLMFDEAEEIIPGERVKGFKMLSKDEWFFKCHFEKEPMMPGVLQLEAIVQICALCILSLPGHKGKIAYLTNADKIKFRRKVVPGDRLNLDAKLHSWKRGIAKCSGSAKVNDELACQAEFTLILPDVVNEYRVS